MKIYIQILLAIFLSIVISQTSGLSASSKSFQLPQETPSPGGFWRTKTEWKAYWVKDWVAKKVYVPFWKKVWGPTQLREWVPTGVAKPPPGWRPPSKIIH